MVWTKLGDKYIYVCMHVYLCIILHPTFLSTAGSHWRRTAGDAYTGLGLLVAQLQETTPGWNRS